MFIYVIYGYLIIGAVYGYFTLKETLVWMGEKYPTTDPKYLKALPKGFKSTMLKVASINILGFTVLIHMIIMMALYPVEVIYNVVMRGKKQ